jgi:restriction system protein
MSEKENKKDLKEKNRLYSVLMDKYDASKNISKAIGEIEKQDYGSKIIKIDITATYKLLIQGLGIEYQKQSELGKKFSNVNKINEAEIISRNLEIIQENLISVEQAYSEWGNIKLVHPKSNKKKQKLKRISRGLRTQEQEFRIPILKVIVENGGAGKVNDILPIVESKMKNILRPSDYDLVGNSNEVRWRNTARWERKRMKDDGLLRKDSKKGVWEVSQNGRHLLSESNWEK